MHVFAALIIIFSAAQACIFLSVCLLALIPRRAKKSRYLIVCGARVWPDATPSRALVYRLQKALEAYNTGLFEKIIVTGGRGSDEPAPEAEIMKHWLTQNGVPSERVLTECASENTIENLKNAKALMNPQKDMSCTVVTSDYHLLRTLFLARILKMNASGLAAKSVTRFPKWLEGRIRETVSWQILLIKLLLGKIG